ncbi:MAG: hypothetical protein IPN26_02565 [Bacteroidetes bacterium]|nr:hypothetical protein [Bacteroidota bacterium]
MVHLEMRFVRPAKYDEQLTIRTPVTQATGPLHRFHVELFNEQGRIVEQRACPPVFCGNVPKTIHAPGVIGKLRPYFNA